jgi:hypothetical protein
MEKYIHEYLTATYYLNQDSLDRYWIYTKKDPYSHFGIRDNILLDLKDIYGLEVVESKLIVYRWAIKINDDVDLDYFWAFEEPKYEESIKPSKYHAHFPGIDEAILPIVQRISARTIGMDLVSVQPMSAPKGNLFYLDMVYNGPKKLTKYQKIKRVLNKIIIFIRKHLVLPNKYNTFVTQKK